MVAGKEVAGGGGGGGGDEAGLVRLLWLRVQGVLKKAEDRRSKSPAAEDRREEEVPWIGGVIDEGVDLGGGVGGEEEEEAAAENEEAVLDESFLIGYGSKD